MTETILSTYGLADRLTQLWKEIERDAQDNFFTLEADCIIAVNEKVAKALGAKPGAFLNKENWSSFVEACGNIGEDSAQKFSWIFSSLYWNHLTRFKLASVWLYKCLEDTKWAS